MGGNQGTADFSPFWCISLFQGSSCSHKKFARGLAGGVRACLFLRRLGSERSQFVSGSTWTRGTWAAFLSLLLIHVCIAPTGWTKSSSVKCIY